LLVKFFTLPAVVVIFRPRRSR